MKRKFSVILLATLVAATGLVGCKKTPKNLTPLGGRPTDVPNSDNPGGLRNGNNLPGNRLDLGDPTRGATVNGDPNGDGSGPGLRPSGVERPDILQGQTIYFDFDKSAIRPGETSKLKAVAAYLKNNPTARLKIAGNCDERGTEEYNRSLGERRALAAMDYLVKNESVDASRVTTVSNGEDDPAEPGHDESAWSKNRRDDFIVINPQ